MAQARYSKVLIVLKDASSHKDYNKRILEYLNDRHTAINDNKYTIAIEVADESNIDNLALQGVESLPAMRISTEDPYIYGVNSILAMLAKLEIMDSENSTTSKFQSSRSDPYNEDAPTNAFMTMALEEMQNGDEDDATAPSTIKAYREDFAETPLSEKMIEDRTKAYTKVYEDRRRRADKMGGHKPSGAEYTPGGNSRRQNMNVDSFIQKGRYDKDKGEDMLMRQIAANL